jgi:hypothetical protein
MVKPWRLSLWSRGAYPEMWRLTLELYLEPWIILEPWRLNLSHVRHALEPWRLNLSHVRHALEPWRLNLELRRLTLEPCGSL